MKKFLFVFLMCFAANPLLAEELIRIYGDGQQTVVEYRQGGQIKKVSVDPALGPKYLLVNHQGLGGPVANQPEMLMELNTPSWIVLEW